MSTTTAPNKPSFTPPTPSPEYLATQKVAQRLVELCSTGKNQQAILDEALAREAGRRSPGQPLA